MTGNRRNTPISPAEAALFRAAVEDANPLPSDGRIVSLPDMAAPIIRRKAYDDPPVQTDNLSDHPLWEYGSEGSDELVFLRPGLRRDTLRKLRRGHWPLQAELDLHGMVSEQARQAVIAFLASCSQQDLRSVRIIHGKGMSSRNHEAVLRGKVKSWLMQREDVLAFCQARSIDGGSGAVVVLLKAG